MNSQTSILDDYISQADLAEQLGKCVRTLKRWHSLRQGPKPVRIGKGLYYHRQDVHDWLESLRQAETV